MGCNNGVDWHDLTGLEKFTHLVEENTWLAGVLAAEMGIDTTHQQNLKMARRFVARNYPKLWELIHGNGACLTWPSTASLRDMVRKAQGM